MIFLGRRRLPLCCTLLFCLLLGCVSAESIIATVGTDVTLTCNYDAQYYGRHPVCWGRGAISFWDCADEVIKSDRTLVTSSLSKRYLLMGDFDKGDVSLIIRQVDESDSGVYNCRVEIPGWFYDYTHEVTLTVVPAPPNALVVETTEVNEKTITVSWSPVFDGARSITSYRIDLKNKQEVLTTSTFKIVEEADPELVSIGNVATLEQFKAFLGVENIGRMAAIFLFTIIIILGFIFRKCGMDYVPPCGVES